MSVDEVVRRVISGQRIEAREALLLLREADLFTLGSLSTRVRNRLNRADMVTYTVDRNINYTNICVSRCKFCAFWRNSGDSDSFVLDIDTLKNKVKETKAIGGTHILLQGGLNPDLDLSYHESLLSVIRAEGLHVHGYSPPEIIFFSRRFKLSIPDVIERLIQAGLGSIPGGGAEILTDRVRSRISPNKISSQEWLMVMEEAHRQGLRTTATMMFGHVEKDEDQILHLERIRNLQDKTGGFTAFIPWTYQPSPGRIPGKKPHSYYYLRLLSVSRIFLDNIPHIQASLVTQGQSVGQVALRFGADDMGSTMIEENVVASAGLRFTIDESQIIRLINDAGFRARKRDVFYNPV